MDDHAAATELAPGISISADAIRLQYARSGGPGGQNVNKVNTKVELWIRLSGIRGMTFDALARLRLLAQGRVTQDDEIHLRAETERSQQANRKEVFERLRQLIIEARIVPKRRRKTKPTKGSQLRRLDSKKRRSQIKSHRQSSSED